MKKINFAFLKNKLFLTGLLSGVIITAAVAILVFSLSYPPVGASKAKGTLLPEIGWSGVVQGCGSQCDYIWVDVLFGSQGNNILIRCHSENSYTNGTGVTVISTPPGDFCQGNGIWVSDGSTPGQI